MSSPVPEGMRITATGGWPAAVQLVLFSILLFALGWLVLNPIGPVVPAVVILLYGAASLIVTRLCRQSSAATSYQRFHARQTLASLAYFLVLLGSIGANQSFDLARPMLWLLAIATSIPLVAAIGMIGLYLKEETDEFQRTVFINAQVLAMGATLSLCTVYGMLETFRLVRHLQLWYVFPIFVLCSGPARTIVLRRYR